MKPLPRLTKEDLWKRLEHFAAETGIIFHQTGRGRLDGRPDMRAFTPHLRTVNLNREQTTACEPWLMHDLLHIVFYDFVNSTLGPSSWLERERFLENHLASEAFAVVMLDYFVLSAERGRTLTVEFCEDDWTEYRNTNPNLRALRTFEFCEMLLEHYLTGDHSKFKPAYGSKKYDEWLGHEIRYARKQRTYVNQWFYDLEGTAFPGETAEIHGSFVAEPFWELAEILFSPDEHRWSKHVAEIASAKNHQEQCFAGFAKYRRSREDYDFRFTDIAAVDRGFLDGLLSKTGGPNDSALFASWQLLSLGENQSTFGPGVPTAAQWPALISAARAELTRLPPRPDPARLSAFFLP